jgi:nucleoside-triphosphatase
MLLEAVAKPHLNWLVIDEIGPLELRGEGLHPAFNLIFDKINPPHQIVLVVREHLLSAVFDYYRLHRFANLKMKYE